MDYLIDIEPERIKELKPSNKTMNDTELKTLEYPPLTEDLEEAKAHLDEYGMALIANVLDKDEVEEMDKRLNEQFLERRNIRLDQKFEVMKVLERNLLKRKS